MAHLSRSERSTSRSDSTQQPAGALLSRALRQAHNHESVRPHPRTKEEAPSRAHGAQRAAAWATSSYSEAHCARGAVIRRVPPEERRRSAPRWEGVLQCLSRALLEDSRGFLHVSWTCPQRDSNPRYGLERAVTWAASRWGPVGSVEGLRATSPSTLAPPRAGSSAGRAGDF